MAIARHVIEGARYYSIPGHKTFFPSVTTVLKVINKPSLQSWQQRVTLDCVKELLKTRPTHSLTTEEEEKWVEGVISTANVQVGGHCSTQIHFSQADKIRNEAANFGTRAHNFLDENLMNDKMSDSVPDELRHVVQGVSLV